MIDVRGRPPNEVLVTLAASPIRRGLGVGGLALLGLILLFVAASGRDSFFATLTIALAAVIALLLAYRMFNATAATLELRGSGLYTSDGRIVAAIDNVQEIEMGVFAFKPSNGFVIFLNQPMVRSWNPGLWWRIGRRVGVGGVTSRAEGKVMAEAMTLLVHDNSAKLKRR